MTTPANLQQGLAAFAQAQALHRARQFREAAGAYSQALAKVPNHPAIVDAFAQLAVEVQDWKLAEKLLLRLVALQPANAGHENRLARCLAHLGNWQDAYTHADKAWSIKQSAGNLYMLMSALHQLGRKDDLEKYVQEALTRFPDNQAIRAVSATHLLKAGTDYERAFSMLADMRAVADPTSNVTQQLADSTWDGKPFTGTLHVVADAGLGDQLLGASILPDVIRLGQRAQLVCAPRLRALLQRSFPEIECIAADAAGRTTGSASTSASNADDRHIQVIELGRFFRRQREDFPQSGNWLRADEERTAAIRQRYAAMWPGKRLVGISWKSARRMEDGASKTIELGELVPLLCRLGCAFINLQYGDIAKDIAVLKAAHGIALFADPDIDTTADIDGLAAQINALDLVITTSNVTAHIAGALGKPCWLILPKTRPVLWYWGYDGDNTPWYPSIRIFRSTRDDDDRRELISHIAAAL